MTAAGAAQWCIRPFSLVDIGLSGRGLHDTMLVGEWACPVRSSRLDSPLSSTLCSYLLLCHSDHMPTLHFLCPEVNSYTWCRAMENQAIRVSRSLSWIRMSWMRVSKSILPSVLKIIIPECLLNNAVKQHAAQWMCRIKDASGLILLTFYTSSIPVQFTGFNGDTPDLHWCEQRIMSIVCNICIIFQM